MAKRARTSTPTARTPAATRTPDPLQADPRPDPAPLHLLPPTLWFRNTWWDTDGAPRDLLLFYEYVPGDNGAGLEASHQTGWTGLAAPLIHLLGAAAEGQAVPDRFDRPLPPRRVATAGRKA